MCGVFFICIVIVLATSCRTVSSERHFQESGVTILFKLPNGWIVRNVEAPSDYHNLISPVEATKPSDPAISIDFFKAPHPRPTIEAEQARKYLEEIHASKDDKVQMEISGAMDSPVYGRITQYRYFSDYYGNHLVSFVVTNDGYALVELWVDTAQAQECKRLEPDFREVVQSIRIQRGLEVQEKGATSHIY